MKKFDAILVLGRGTRRTGAIPSSMRASVDEAVELYKSGVSDHVIFCGKWSYQIDYVPEKTEAKLMADYAKSIGLPEKAIFIEDKSEATVLNICYAKQKYLAPNNWTNILVISIYPLEDRMAYNFRMVLGPDYSFEFEEIDFRFPPEKEAELIMSEQNKLKNDVPKFFEGITPGDDKKIARKAIEEIRKMTESRMK